VVEKKSAEPGALPLGSYTAFRRASDSLPFAIDLAVLELIASEKRLYLAFTVRRARHPNDWLSGRKLFPIRGDLRGSRIYEAGWREQAHEHKSSDNSIA
jgi:hypothetical protein